MMLVPAIDIYRGRLVRMRQGRASDVIHYSGDPLVCASELISMGAGLLHLVDLDAALSTGFDNSELVKKMLSLGVDVQVAGGIRSEERARLLMGLGARRLVIGTMFLESPEVALRLLAEYGRDSIAVALDYRGGYVLSRGWTNELRLPLEDALRRAYGEFSWVLLTDASRDGMLQGPDIQTLERVKLSFPKFRIMAAGGVRDLLDLLSMSSAGVDCAIVGRAVLEERINFVEALKVVQGC
jgi:phosphoribosylformimino-5-aminoimidazole carboxamide ribotide isomerase